VAKLFDEISDTLRAFIEAQPMFFVGTAPSGSDGHVNLSPKGGEGLFQVTGPLGFAYVDLMGSGIETIAHLRENGRIVVMFCSFDGPPKIVRLHGRGHVIQQGDDAFAERLATFDVSDEQRRAVRSVIEVEVTRVADSCGFVVPRMTYEGERDQLYRYADNRLRKEGPEAVRAYVSANNAESIDGLTGLDSLVDGGASSNGRATAGRKL
jgi:predicted pyridoxine 5'-phosphate oxidase superfamily flavin-nucleotide-binding protein